MGTCKFKKKTNKQNHASKSSTGLAGDQKLAAFCNFMPQRELAYIFDRAICEQNKTGLPTYLQLYDQSSQLLCQDSLKHGGHARKPLWNVELCDTMG